MIVEEAEDPDPTAEVRHEERGRSSPVTEILPTSMQMSPNVTEAQRMAASVDRSTPATMENMHFAARAAAVGNQNNFDHSRVASEEESKGIMTLVNIENN